MTYKSYHISRYVVTFDKILCRFKSKEVVLSVKDRTLKKGIFVDWKCQPFFMEVYIETEKSVEKVKLFYPFKFEEYGDQIQDTKNELYLDYNIKAFNEGVGGDFVDDVSNLSHHKFLNSIVSICQV